MAHRRPLILRSGEQTANGESEISEAAAEMLVETAVPAAKEIPITPHDSAQCKPW